MAQLIGEVKVLANLNKEVRRIKHRTKSGMMAALLLIKADSMEDTPVDTGNLKGGHYTHVDQDSAGVNGEVGVMAEYGVHVHENLESRHEVGKAKFLEDAIKNNVGKILDIIAKAVKL